MKKAKLALIIALAIPSAGAVQQSPVECDLPHSPIPGLRLCVDLPSDLGGDFFAVNATYWRGRHDAEQRLLSALDEVRDRDPLYWSYLESQYGFSLEER